MGPILPPIGAGRGRPTGSRGHRPSASRPTPWDRQDVVRGRNDGHGDEGSGARRLPSTGDADIQHAWRNASAWSSTSTSVEDRLLVNRP
ncbi:hypothetical protein [Ornithinimicrobium kibberense]|uniref:hypothetical protein n=1 Tax=Ornithinimicrobium kibberense TaxID=282060 RepID=UPI00361AA28A